MGTIDNEFFAIAKFDGAGNKAVPMGYSIGTTYELRLVCLHDGRLIVEPINIDPKPMPILYLNFISFLNNWDDIKTTF